MRIALGQINPIVGDLDYNTSTIIKMVKQVDSGLILFPELALSGYPPEDFLLLPHFIEAAEQQLKKILPYTKGITAVVGLPRRNVNAGEKKVFNSAAILHDGKLLGFQDKSLLPTYDVFDERRYFEEASETLIWEIAGSRFAVTICEDIWQHSQLVPETSYKHDPVAALKGEKLDFILNLSASPFSQGKLVSRMDAGSYVAKSLNCLFYQCNQVGANDSLIFDGRSYSCDATGKFTGVAAAFKEQLYVSDGTTVAKEDEVQLLHDALVLGIRDYFFKLGFTQACLGLSGGIDSALVACLAVEALGAENVHCILMPSRYSSEGSRTDAHTLVSNLGISSLEISIEAPFTCFLDLLEPHFAGLPVDATEENLQARIRGMILMAFSNKKGYIILSTGNKSEMAMGYSTLYGDLCGGLAVLSDVLKQDVYRLANWINRSGEVIPNSIITKPPSAELRPNQKDSDTLPDYAIVDKVLRLYVEEHRSPEQIVSETGFDASIVEGLIKRIHQNEYKRRQSPPGLRVSHKAFTVGRKFPIVQGWV